jgi:valyl-tRNA synthetase
MMGYEVLWMPGTDHAGIATQAVVEKRLLKEENKRRKDFSREEFIARVQTWKDEYEARITEQLKAMGCSCDFSRQRFTMDDICARAVREAFFRLFKDGLIYRGKRLVNWDPALQTAVADDECYEEEVEAAFYYLRYPLVAARNGQRPHGQMAKEEVTPVAWGELAERGYPLPEGAERDLPAWITVATTRPETYLGDTAVAISQHDPRAAALRGLQVQLPLVGRVIPIIEDTSGYVVLPKAYARSDEERDDPKAEFATGFLKVTPAHDNNDYQLGQLYGEQIKANSTGEVLINILSPDGRLSDQHGWTDVGDARRFVGLKAMQTHDGIRQPAEARKAVVEALKNHPIGSDAFPVLEKVRPYRQTLKFSDRSKALIEPYLSDQWFCKVTDDRMAGAANRALERSSTSPSASGGTGDPPVPGTSEPSTRLGPASADLSRSQRNLPHFEQGGSTYFLTFTVREGALSPAERDQVLAAIRHWHGDRIELHAAVVMPDHAHMLLTPLRSGPGQWHSLASITHSIKSITAHQISKQRGEPVSLWQDESFDSQVRREGELAEKMAYILEAPVRDGLVPDWTLYPHLWVSPLARQGKREFGHLSRPPSPADAEEHRGDACATDSGVGGLGDGSLRFHPDRYAKTYEQWHANIRDWCISRQLWWGHRIPVWSLDLDSAGHDRFRAHWPRLQDWQAQGRIHGRGTAEGDDSSSTPNRGWYFVSVRSADDREVMDALEQIGFTQDPDVLDTWFSSALWPLSTLGWPDPDQSPDTKGLLSAFNPSSLLSTAREIITLWVSRMVMMNRYLLGEGGGRGPVPFKDVFIHAVVQDGDGKRMSKSAGNGVDPLDIIASHGADAMRFTLCQMTTSTQDVRMPVVKDAKTGRNTSPKFDLGRNVCNKLWNAARFAMTMLEGASGDSRLTPRSLSPVDRWMLSRLSQASAAIAEAIKNYEFSVYAQALYDLLWRDFCDWYLEAIKPTVQTDPGTRAVLVHTLEAILRLAHPLLPYVTEAIYEHVRRLEAAPIPGVDFGRPMPEGTPLALMPWPAISGSLRDAHAEREFGALQDLAGIIREARSQHKVEPRRKIVLHADASALAPLGGAVSLLPIFAGLERIEPAPKPGQAPPSSVSITFGPATLVLSSLAEQLDAGAERERLSKQVADLAKSIAALEGRLANPGYLAKAPPKLVDETKAEILRKKAELEAARKALEVV